MINEIIQPIKDCICSLEFVDQCEGLVHTYSKPIMDRLDGGLYYEAGTVDFPIICNTTFEECESMTSNVTPDGSRKSVFYFDKVDDWSSPFAYNDKTKQFNGRIMLVGWLNLPKLGYDDCTIKDRVIGHLLKVICSKFAKPVQSIGVTKQLCVDFAGVTDTPFAKYSQDLYKRWTCSPYEAFGIYLDIETQIAPHCFEDFEIKEPLINC